jgi:aminoglycoside 3-N-acetyltransferase I
MSFTVRRLVAGELDLARRTFAAMADGFEDAWAPLSDAYLGALLARPDLLILTALDGDRVVGGLTAFVLPMARAEVREVFIYDLAIAPADQRRGAGAALLAHLRSLARALGAANSFVPADVEDTHALRFYEAQGGVAADVTMFTFDAE